jgi:hypothetical protein
MTRESCYTYRRTETPAAGLQHLTTPHRCGYQIACAPQTHSAAISLNWSTSSAIDIAVVSIGGDRYIDTLLDHFAAGRISGTVTPDALNTGNFPAKRLP